MTTIQKFRNLAQTNGYGMVETRDQLMITNGNTRARLVFSKTGNLIHATFFRVSDGVIFGEMYGRTSNKTEKSIKIIQKG